MDFPSDFGRYEILSLVGKGAMGSVYRARHKALENIVAVKILHPQISANQKLVQRFLTEAKAAGRLSHPNVVRGLDAGELDGRYYLVMEFVDGLSLDRIIASEGHLLEESALRIALDMAKALEHARENQVVHRDVKPANILVASDGRAKLTDLGLATRLDIDAKKPGGAMGTPDYISPEQIQARSDVDIRSDLYALGCTLFHMLTGHPPFSGDPNAVMAHHLTDPVPDPRDEVPEISEAAVSILRRLTEKRRQDRYQTPAALATDLERALSGRGTSARPSGRAPAARRPRASTGFNLGVAGVAMAVLVVGVLVALAMTSGGPSPPDPSPEKPPARRPDPGDPVASKIEQEGRRAEEALEKARRFHASQPEEYDQAIRMFQEVVSRFESDWQKIALDEIVKVRGARERRAEELFRDPLRQAEAAEREERFGDGRRILQATLSDRKAVFGETRAWAQAGEELKALAGRAAALVQKLEGEARQALNAQDFALARSLAARIRAADPDDFGSRSEALLREASESERKKNEAEQEREGMALLAEARRKARESVRAWKWMEAVEPFESVRAKAKSPAVWRIAALEAADLDLLAAFWKALGEAKGAAGKDLSVGGRAGKVADVAGGYVHLMLGPVRTAFRLQELKPDEIARLAELGLPPAEAKWRRGLAVYFLYQDLPDRAGAVLQGLELTDEEREFYRGKTGK